MQLSQGQQGIVALLRRALALDTQAHARIAVREGGIECFVTTPFSVVAARRAQGTFGSHGAVYRAADLLNPEGSELVVEPHPSAGGALSWPGALPPAEGYERVESIPGAAVRQLVDAGRGLAKQFSTAMGPPASLLNSTVISCSTDTSTVDVPMRAVFALNACGFIPTDTSEPSRNRLLVSLSGRWVRIDAYYGTVYYRAGTNSLTDLL
ncbi:hypothetical protein CCICO_02655 [Corynebacterium ciconiae DSM 44920]|nr:hypothetical protein CCICO_02655 [Corynebacterium ciconiae DSM 44920]